MGFIAGDITEIGWSHPELGTGIIYPKTGEDGTFDLGGLRSADDANMVAGNGAMIDQMNRARWSVEATIANDMGEEVIEKLIALAGHPQPADWTFTHVSGNVYGGSGKPVGDLALNTNAATFSLKVSGGNSLKRQA